MRDGYDPAIVRRLRAWETPILLAFAAHVLLVGPWLAGVGYGTVALGITVALAVLGGIPLAFGLRDLLRSHRRRR